PHPLTIPTSPGPGMPGSDASPQRHSSPHSTAGPPKHPAAPAPLGPATHKTSPGPLLMLKRRHIARPRNSLRHMRPDRQRPQLCPPRLLLRTPRMLGIQVVPQTRPSANQGLRKHGTNPRIMEQPRGANLARQVTPAYDRNNAQLYV